VHAVPAAQGPLRLETPNGTSIKFGLLAQPQYQAQGSTTLDGMAQNLYVRRLRILLGGSLFGVIDYFVDTDFANLFLANNVAGAMGAPNISQKNTPGMNIQDAFVTWKALGDLLKVDVGYMLPPLAHNAVQGATTLYGWDYFGYTFQHNAGANAMAAFQTSGNPVGRDAGLQLRGLLLGGMIEYRAGLFQGLRNAQTAADVGARNFFRATGRLQVNLMDPETGFFYAGSYLGTKKILSVGASADFQDNYRYFAGDVIADLPLGPGVFTGQVNLAHWNGGTWIPTLPDQTALMAEVGYLLGAIPLSPIVRAEHLWVPGPADQTRVGGGLAFWPYGHNSNLKAFYTYLDQGGAPHGAHQFNLQWQVYFF
jgi:hypothetical protein